ncbi:hypothetical protein BGZ63DRAFT_386870 [Mariannaea sp. PMI_226]|nr:hypothetical protein BGZ63DRAFT_386870 [Mariannaea sp. PMI_226]
MERLIPPQTVISTQNVSIYRSKHISSAISSAFLWYKLCSNTNRTSLLPINILCRYVLRTTYGYHRWRLH